MTTGTPSLLDTVRFRREAARVHHAGRGNWLVYGFSASAREGAWLYLRGRNGRCLKARPEDLEVVA